MLLWYPVSGCWDTGVHAPVALAPCNLAVAEARGLNGFSYKRVLIASQSLQYSATETLLLVITGAAVSRHFRLDLGLSCIINLENLIHSTWKYRIWLLKLENTSKDEARVTREGRVSAALGVYAKVEGILLLLFQTSVY